MLVDRAVRPESPDLGRYARLRFERGDLAVYELS
jgi:hypothetical protein